MNEYTVSLFGPRPFLDLDLLDDKLSLTIENLIKTKPNVHFLIGRISDFELYSKCLIERVRKKLGKENSRITLVLPYSLKDPENEKDYYREYYENILILEHLERLPLKYALQLKNRLLVDMSDLVIVYSSDDKTDLSYAAKEYAQRMNKKIIDLYEKKGGE